MDIAIIDDHLILTQSLAYIFGEKGYHVNIFDNAAQFLNNNFLTWFPEIAITDIMMPEMNGIDMMETFKQLQPTLNCKFIFLSSITDAHTIKRAMHAGARGYISKDASTVELINAVKEVAAGHKYLGEAVKEAMLHSVLNDFEPEFNLTLREKEVMILICQGNTPKEIAYRLKLTVNTVQWYIKKIMKKFNVNRTSDMILFAIQNGLYTPAVGS
jgi:two-component system invasion response regulator UvrY